MSKETLGIWKVFVRQVRVMRLIEDGENGGLGKGPESATRYGIMERPRFIFAISDPPPHVKPVFWKFRLCRSLKGVVCSSIFDPFGGGSHVKTPPPRKGLDQPDTAKIASYA